MNAPASVSYAETFLQYFDVCLADDASQQADCFKIRYRVYCEEFGYERAEAFADEAERDDFDRQSLHCLVTHKGTGKPAGCVRVVRPDSAHAGGLLPFEKYCGDSLDADYKQAYAVPGRDVCEVSRLAVDGMFRRRSGEKANRFGGTHISDLSKEERRTFPLIAISCFLAATALTDLSGATNAYAMMEPFLPRILSRAGIDFTRVGQNVDYHGTRAAYFITTEAAVSNMSPDLLELYKAIRGSIAKDYPRCSWT